MKSKEEIEILAEQWFENANTERWGGEELGFINGYSQCQEDVDWELLAKLSKRYTEEDLMSAFNAGINNDYGNGPSFDQLLNSLNKQDDENKNGS